MSAAKRIKQVQQWRAVLYVRISDDPEGLEGVDRQEADCRAFAESHNMVVVVFRENDTSAFKQRTIVLPSGEKVRRVVRPRFRAMPVSRRLSRFLNECVMSQDISDASGDAQRQV